MTKTAVSVVLRRLPYSSLKAGDALQCALDAAAGGQSVSIVLTDGGILLAQKGHHDDLRSTRLEDVLANCLHSGVTVYVHRASLKKYRLREDEIIQGVSIVDSTALETVLMQACTVMMF